MLLRCGNTTSEQLHLKPWQCMMQGHSTMSASCRPLPARPGPSQPHPSAPAAMRRQMLRMMRPGMCTPDAVIQPYSSTASSFTLPTCSACSAHPLHASTCYGAAVAGSMHHCMHPILLGSMHNAPKKLHLLHAIADAAPNRNAKSPRPSKSIPVSGSHATRRHREQLGATSQQSFH